MQGSWKCYPYFAIILASLYEPPERKQIASALSSMKLDMKILKKEEQTQIKSKVYTQEKS